MLNHSTNVPVASAPLPTRFHGGCATACFHATHIQQLPWKSFLDGLALPTAYATANYPVTYPSHLHQGTRRVGPNLHGQSKCRRRCTSCKLHGTRARGMMRRTIIKERGARATGSKRTWGWERRAGEDRVGARTVSAAAAEERLQEDEDEESA